MLPVRVHTPMTIHQKFYCEYVGAWHLHPQFQLRGVKFIRTQIEKQTTSAGLKPSGSVIGHSPIVDVTLGRACSSKLFHFAWCTWMDMTCQ